MNWFSLLIRRFL